MDHKWKGDVIKLELSTHENYLYFKQRMRGLNKFLRSAMSPFITSCYCAIN